MVDKNSDPKYIENAIRHLKVGNFTGHQLDMAIKALEKELPQKPEIKVIDGDPEWFCACGIYFAPTKDKTLKYCYGCGKKIDWD